MSSMLGCFVFTGLIAAIFMLFVVMLFPPAQGVVIQLPDSINVNHVNIAQQMVGIFTVSDLGELLSHNNMLAIIFFAALVGFATAASKEKGAAFANLLNAGTDVFMQVVTYIMYYAPIGLPISQS